MNDYERKAINECVEPVLTAIALDATYAALELAPRGEEETEHDTLPEDEIDEEEIFWPDGAKTRNHELEQSW